jgi:hypothetical protein
MRGRRGRRPPIGVREMIHYRLLQRVPSAWICGGFERGGFAMAVAKGLHPAEARRCAAETESICWAMIVILLALIGFAAFIFLEQLGG